MHLVGGAERIPLRDVEPCVRLFRWVSFRRQMRRHCLADEAMTHANKKILRPRTTGSTAVQHAAAAAAAASSGSSSIAQVVTDNARAQKRSREPDSDSDPESLLL